MKEKQIAAYFYDGNNVRFEVTDLEEALDATDIIPDLCPLFLEDIEKSLSCHSLASVMTRLATEHGYDAYPLKKDMITTMLANACIMLLDMDAEEKVIQDFDDLLDRETMEIVSIYGDPDDPSISTNTLNLTGYAIKELSAEEINEAMLTMLARAIATISQDMIARGMSEEDAIRRAVTAVPEAINDRVEGIELHAFTEDLSSDLWWQVPDDEKDPHIVS